MATRRRYLVVIGVLLAALCIGQVLAYLLAPASWKAFVARLPAIVTMLAFWGPVVAIMAAALVWIVLRMLGFRSLEQIRVESVEQNNPTPAIAFVGTLIASILFLMMVIRP